MSKKHHQRNTSDSIEKKKEESLKDIQGTPNFTGSSYNSKGSVDHGKVRSNRKRR